MLLAGANTIRDVIAFPKSTQVSPFGSHLLLCMMNRESRPSFRHIPVTGLVARHCTCLEMLWGSVADVSGEHH